MLALPVFIGEKLPIQNNNGIIQPDSRHVRLPPWPWRAQRSASEIQRGRPIVTGGKLSTVKSFSMSEFPPGQKKSAVVSVSVHKRRGKTVCLHISYVLSTAICHGCPKKTAEDIIFRVGFGAKKWWSSINDPLTGVLTEREFKRE